MTSGMISNSNEKNPNNYEVKSRVQSRYHRPHISIFNYGNPTSHKKCKRSKDQQSQQNC